MDPVFFHTILTLWVPWVQAPGGNYFRPLSWDKYNIALTWILYPGSGVHEDWEDPSKKLVEQEGQDLSECMMQVLKSDDPVSKPKGFNSRPAFLRLEAEGCTELPPVPGFFWVTMRPPSSGTLNIHTLTIADTWTVLLHGVTDSEPSDKRSSSPFGSFGIFFYQNSWGNEPAWKAGPCSGEMKGTAMLVEKCSLDIGEKTS